jgi:hypothetical protein
MTPLTIFSCRKFPSDGWIANGKIVFPPNAYTQEIYWLSHLMTVFPKLKERIKDWRLNSSEMDYLVYTIIEVLNRKYGRKL